MLSNRETEIIAHAELTRDMVQAMFERFDDICNGDEIIELVINNNVLILKGQGDDSNVVIGMSSLPPVLSHLR